MSRPTKKATPVLLIDDDEDDYLLTREYFEDFERPRRYELQWASTYDEGLQLLQQADHDLCLLDYRLGARDGVELLQQALDAECSTPIIMLTGSGNRAVDNAAMRHGAADYLVKEEITPVLLERSIRHSLERHRILEKQRTLAAENERLYRKAKRALDMRDEIHRIVAHDLRGPLSTMGLALQLMERLASKGADGDAFANQLETQRLCISQMNRLIQDLLDAARIDDGRLSLDRTAYQPVHIVESVLDQHRIRAEDRSIELVANISDELPHIDADARRIEQVFSNLIGNALKFTPEGGTIEITARTEEDAVCFLVEDNGRGIPEELQPHLFDRFWQAEQGDLDGAGLGLAICKGILDAHGGRIWAESTEGEGTTFFFTVPTVSD